MEKKFDITTTKGLKAAIEELGNKDLLLFLIPGAGPAAYVGKKIYDLASSVLSTNELTIEQQKKAAEEIIKQGKESDASRIKITLNQKAGLDIGSEIEGMPVKKKMGKFDNMTLEVYYK